MAVLVSTMWGAGRALGGSEARPPQAAATHVVAEGETLWQIARDLVGPEGDPRPVVEQIREANGLGTGVLLEGQRLLLPAG